MKTKKMKTSNDRTEFLKTDDNYQWIAVTDPASGSRGRYTVYRVHRWSDKRAEIVGRELDLKTARKVADEHKDEAAPSGPRLDHECDWRTAAIKLAQCVALTIRTGGKIGVGSGMVMKVVDGKKTIERWDKDFVEALAFIGIEVVDKADKKPKRARSRSAAA